MDSSIIDASDRFSASPARPKTTVVDALRRIGRISPPDRAILAERLGLVAARLDSDKPTRVVKRWFDTAWSGDRWAKRRRYVILPGETAPDPRNDGAYVASGSDWAALVEQAALAQHPGNDPSSSSDRLRAARDLLRGTSLLPSFAPIPLHGDNAQSLVASYAERVSTAIDKGSAIRQLWTVLASSPFQIGIQSADSQATVPAPLQPAAAHASQAAIGQYRMDAGFRYEFVPDPKAEHQEWARPMIRLGLRAHRRRSRIFVVPQTVIRPDGSDDELPPEEMVSDWLAREGLLLDGPRGGLADVAYDPAKGYGWQSFHYDIVQAVHLEARIRPDGALGLWISAQVSDQDHYHPFTIGCDTAAVEASRTGWHSFIGMPLDFKGPASWFMLLEWPVYDSAFMRDGHLPYGAVSGLVEPDDREFTDVEGWIDDAQNAEVQDLLFGTANGVRFLPSVAVDRQTPSPCSEQAVASAFFRNLPAPFEDRIAHRLLEQADRYARAGLAYHDAVVAHHRALIDRMAGE